MNAKQAAAETRKSTREAISYDASTLMLQIKMEIDREVRSGFGCRSIHVGFVNYGHGRSFHRCRHDESEEIVVNTLTEQGYTVKKEGGSWTIRW